MWRGDPPGGCDGNACIHRGDELAHRPPVAEPGGGHGGEREAAEDRNGRGFHGLSVGATLAFGADVGAGAGADAGLVFGMGLSLGLGLVSGWGWG